MCCRAARNIFVAQKNNLAVHKKKFVWCGKKFDRNKQCGDYNDACAIPWMTKVVREKSQTIIQSRIISRNESNWKCITWKAAAAAVAAAAAKKKKNHWSDVKPRGLIKKETIDTCSHLESRPARASAIHKYYPELCIQMKKEKNKKKTKRNEIVLFLQKFDCNNVVVNDVVSCVPTICHWPHHSPFQTYSTHDPMLRRRFFFLSFFFSAGLLVLSVISRLAYWSCECVCLWAMKCEHSFNYSRFLLFGGAHYVAMRVCHMAWPAYRVSFYCMLPYHTVNAHFLIVCPSGGVAEWRRVCAIRKFQTQPFMNNGPFTNFHFDFGRRSCIVCWQHPTAIDEFIYPIFVCLFFLLFFCFFFCFCFAQLCAGQRFTQFTRELY